MEKQGNSELVNFLLLAAGALSALSCLLSVFSLASSISLMHRYGTSPLIGIALRTLPWMFLWAALAVAGFLRWKYTLPVLAVLSPMLLVFAVRPLFFRAGLGNPVVLMTVLAGVVLKLALAGVGLYGTLLWWKERSATPSA